MSGRDNSLHLLQQEAVTADKVNITLISKLLVFIGGLQWSGPLIFFFFYQKNRIFIVYVQPAKTGALLDLEQVPMGTERVEPTLDWECYYLRRCLKISQLFNHLNKDISFS